MKLRPNKPSADCDVADTDIPLPSAIKGVYQAVNEIGQKTGRLVIESTDSSGADLLHVMDQKQLILGQYDNLAQFAVAAGLHQLQSRKGLQELFATVMQMTKPLAYLADRDGYHRVEHGGEIIEFFVWKGKIYFFSDKKPALVILLSATITALPPSSGSLEDWKKEVGDIVVTNPYLLVVVCSAITSLLGRAFQLQMLVLMLVGGSSQGKTTAQMVGQSLIKTGKNIESFSGTTKGIQALLGKHHDSPAFMDEIRQADSPADIIKLIFEIGNGASRKTSSASQASLKTDVLSCGLILSNEISLAEIATGSRVRISEGIGARFFELQLRAPHGAFHFLPEGMTAKQLSEHLQQITARLYGIFWDALIPYVAKNAANIRLWIYKQLPVFEAELQDGLSINDPVTARLVRGMAGWALAGALAVRFKLLNTDRKTVMAAIRMVLVEHLHRNTHGSHRIAEHVISTLRNEIDRNTIKFQALATFHSSDHSGIYGYYRGNDKDGIYLILPSVFEQLVGEKFGVEAAARVLKDAGFLKCDPGGYQYQIRIPGSGTNGKRKRFYAIDGAIRFDGQHTTGQ